MAKTIINPNASKLINNVAKKNEKIEADGKKHDIPMDKIVMNKWNEYLFGAKEIDSFAENIEEEGFHGAIEVYALADGTYEIYSGHRRYLAMKKLGEKTIPCIVNKNVDDNTKLAQLINSNIHNRNLSALNYARNIQKYKEIFRARGEKGNMRVLLSKKFGMSPSQIHRYERILNLIPELQEFTDDTTFPYSALIEADKLSKEQQGALAKEISIYVELKKSEIQNEGSEDSNFNKADRAFVISKLRIDQMINAIVIKDKRVEEKKQQDKDKVESLVQQLRSEIPKENIHVFSNDVMQDKSSEIKNDIDIENELETLNVYMKDMDEDNTIKNKSNSNEEVIIPEYYIDDELAIFIDRINRVIEKEFKIADRKRIDIMIKSLEHIISKLK